ncbi:MAG: aldehyde ferredoxin oxidoreductase family protein [bacterium]
MKPASGRILWVDLTSGASREEALSDAIYDQFLGGLGLAAAVLTRAIPAGADPLGPDNVLAFVPGLLAGTPSFFTGRWMAAAKSPLTGTWGDANCGGNLALAIRQCGYDGIFIQGISEKPVYLLLDNGSVELRDASAVWGKDTVETERMLTEEVSLPKRPAIASIGPAGEKRSLISGIVNDGGRIAARSGLGAVMGSKRLKALVLAGSKPVQTEAPEEMRRLSRRLAGILAKRFPLPGPGVFPWLGALLRLLPWTVRLDGILLAEMLCRWGTSGMNEISLQWGDAPVLNWAGSERDFPLRSSSSIRAERIMAGEERRYHCLACPLGCGSLLRRSGELMHKPEYETIMAFTALLGNTDLEAVFRLNEALNRAGMDTISAGGTVAWAIECVERGILSRQEVDGLDLRWGNAEAIEELVRKMTAREGIGDLLADGSRKAAQRVGKDSQAWAVEAGGQELALHDSRLDPGLALHAVADPSPGRHSQGGYIYYDTYRLWAQVPGLPRPHLLEPKGKRFQADRANARKGAAVSRFHQLYNAAGLCMFGAYLGPARLPLFSWLNAAAGWKRSPAEYMEVGWRIQTLRQLFNLKQGIDPRAIGITPRAVGDPPLTEGGNRGRRAPIRELTSLYWEEMGWDPKTGIPTEETVEALGLGAFLERGEGG